MVESDRHRLCKDDVPDSAALVVAPAQWQCDWIAVGVRRSWQVLHPLVPALRSAGTGKTVKDKRKRARRIRLFQGVVRRRPPLFIAIIYHTGRNYATVKAEIERRANESNQSYVNCQVLRLLKSSQDFLYLKIIPKN